MIPTRILFYIKNDEQFGRSPDGVGMVWYDNEDDARGSHEPVVTEMNFDNGEDFDDYREEVTGHRY